MKNNRLASLTVLLLFALTILVFQQPAWAAEYRFKGGDEGTARDIDRRFGGWVSKGADADRLDQAIRASDSMFGNGPNSWVLQMTLAGHESEARGADLIDNGNIEEAASAYAQAATFYGIARFPYIHNAEAQAAYEAHNRCYILSRQLMGIPVEQVRIPFEEKEIIGNLYMPGVVASAKPVPLVVISGGIDTWKNESWPTTSAMLAEGMAVFAMDMPGTGESQWLIDPTAGRVYSAALAHLKQRPEIDPDRLAVNLRSFGGYFAVWLALTDPNVKAAVNFAGPIHHAFSDSHFAGLPEHMIPTVAAGFGVGREVFEQNQAEGLAQFMAKVVPMSLVRQGVLKPNKQQAPILSINGDQDKLVPISDLYVISEYGVRQETWVFPGDVHTGAKNKPVNIPGAAAWIKKQLD
ncbi:alpha/beta hydrolase [Pseudomonadota bacterium]